MANIINNNFHNLKMRINRDEYWDFFINKDSLSPYYFGHGDLNDNCLISFIDMSKEECVNGDSIVSLNEYFWESAFTTNYILENIGYTGADNGLIKFLRDRITNKDFIDLYTKSTYEIEDEYNLKLHAVSGVNHLHDYSYEFTNDSVKLNGGFFQGFFKTECGKYEVLPSKLEQGETWDFEFVLKREDLESKSGKRLNDINPNNEGIFFYIGTRAENKWDYLYNKDNDECEVIAPNDYVCGGEIERETYLINNLLHPNPIFTTDDEFGLNNYINFKYFKGTEYIKELDEDDFSMSDYVSMNEKPILIDETKDYTIITSCGFKEITNECSCGADIEFSVAKSDATNFDDYFGDDFLSDIGEIDDDVYLEDDIDISDFDFDTSDGLKLETNRKYYIDTTNKFLMFDRTCDGFNVHNYTSDSMVRYYMHKRDSVGNLFLLMNRTCTGFTVKNIDDYIEKIPIEYNIYNDIYDNALAFRITKDGAIGYRYYTIDCDSEAKTSIREAYSNVNVVKEDEWNVINVKISGYYSTMVIRFYVNGKLVFVSDEMRKINLRKLNEPYSKQEGVPFNISLGGGTQGLCDVVLPNYMLDPYRVYPLEKYFSGTFIGEIKSFKFYNCSKEYLEIFNNFLYENDKMIKL